MSLLFGLLIATLFVYCPDVEQYEIDFVESNITHTSHNKDYDDDAYVPDYFSEDYVTRIKEIFSAEIKSNSFCHKCAGHRYQFYRIYKHHLPHIDQKSIRTLECNIAKGIRSAKRCFDMGLIYEFVGDLFSGSSNNNNDIKPDIAQALKCYKEASIKGDEYAKFRIRILELERDGSQFVTKLGPSDLSYEETIRMLILSCQKKNSLTAEDRKLFLNRTDFELFPNNEEDIRALVEGAKNGNKDNQYKLGLMYEFCGSLNRNADSPTQPDLTKAEEWFKKATDQDHIDAPDSLERVQDKLRSEELSPSELKAPEDISRALPGAPTEIPETMRGRAPTPNRSPSVVVRPLPPKRVSGQ